MSIAHATEVPREATITPGQRDERVRRTVQLCWDHSEFYRERLRAAGAEPGDIRGVEDLDGLPVLLRKDDERELEERSHLTLGHPFGEHLCVPPGEVVTVASTSGTSGTPTFYAFTAQDVATTDELWGRALGLAGIGPGSVVLHGFGLSMFLAGYPLARAVERMGAQIVPVGAEAGSQKLLQVAELTRPHALLCTPSYAGYLIEQAPDRVRALELRAIVCAGEPGAGLPELRARVEEATGATVYDVLGGAHGIINASDGSWPYDGMTVLGDDCSVQQLWDSDRGCAVPIPDDGTPAYGERVKTTLRWRAQPQLRSSVGDVYEMRRVPGEDGRVGTRIRVIGRTDDLLIIKGVKLYPAAARDLVAGFAPRVTGALRLVVHGRPPRVQPPLRLRVERAEGYRSDGDEVLAADIAAAMHQRLSVRPEVEIVDPGTIERSSHKTQLIEVVPEVTDT
jgi:phenylacetate-CoA ligase